MAGPLQLDEISGSPLAALGAEVMVTKVRLSICHANRLFGECLSLALAGALPMDVKVVDEPIGNGAVSVQDDGFDLLLIDAGLPEMKAFRVVQTLKANDESTRAILLISSAAPDLIESCLQVGADGCVLDDDTLDDLRQGIESVLAGRNYCSPKVAQRLFKRACVSHQQMSWNTRVRETRLTRREVEILRMIAQRNLSNKQIAKELRLSIYTVKNHVHSIIEKLSVEDRQTAVRHAVVHGLLRDPVC
jgi:DNA-binding NarL/FixJ family response regulator